MFTKKLVSFALVATVFATLVSFAPPAQAAVGTKNACAITSLSYDAGRIIFNCSTGPISQFYVFLNAPGCTTSDPDSFKVFNSMLQSSVLAAKPVDLVFQPATSTCGVATLVNLTVH
jgi:hypothetical protein